MKIIMQNQEQSSINDVENISSGVKIEPLFISAINLALQQSAFPIIYEIKLKNNTGNELKNLDCIIYTVPDILKKKIIHIEKIDVGEELSLQKINIEPNYNLLVNLSDSLIGKLIFEMKDKDTLITREEHNVTAYAADQWLGLRIMPELFAAFVTPNLEVISYLMSNVADELKKKTGSADIQGYQADKRRIYEICEAIYKAIHAWNIGYANPPSSFGNPGQKIRFADTIYKYRMGTCLDTTLLFASIMEQCNLHPVIIFQHGHSYIGCHLVERYFPDSPMDDLQTIRKLTELDEFLVLETTMVTGNENFSQAEATARNKHLNLDDDFYCAIDVIRARLSGIRPLPLKRSTDGIEFELVEREKRELKADPNRKLYDEIDLSNVNIKSDKQNRIDRWQQNLLDLSLRNRLLNVRDTKQIISIACSDITVLEDKIADNLSFTLNPLSSLLSEKDLHDLSMLRTTNVKNEILDLLDKELSQRRLWTLLSPAELKKRLTVLYRQSKTDLEEGGINTLFLGIGFLEWKQAESDERSFLAPVLLVPVRLHRKSMSEGITITRLDEESVINVTLVELLRREYNLKIPGIDPLPTDDSGVDVNLILQIFRQTIKGIKGWELREEVRLGLFSFAKFIMWNDMANRTEDLKNHPLVNHLVEGGGFFEDGIEAPELNEITSTGKAADFFCPMNADSSQLAAVMYSQLGKSFVLHGPPGTGKSQTITNIIAHNLALGKRILFVSEKKAALDVVYKRLSTISLSPFCLELHSNKAGKAEVLKQFSEAMEIVDEPLPDNWEETVYQLEKLRAELDEYINALHHEYPNGLTAYQCFSQKIANSRSGLEALINMNCLVHTKRQFQNAKQTINDLANAFNATTPEARKKLKSLAVHNWTPLWQADFLKKTEKIKGIIEKLLKSFQEHAKLFGMDEDLYSPENIFNTAKLAEMIKLSENISENFLENTFISKINFVYEFSNVAIQLNNYEEKLKNYRPECYANLECEIIEKRLLKNRSLFPFFRFFANRKLLNDLVELKKLTAGKLTIEELIKILPDINEYNEIRKTYNADKIEAEQLLGLKWKEASENWEKTQEKLKEINELNDFVKNISGKKHNRLVQIYEQLQKILPTAQSDFAKDTQKRKKINQLLNHWNNFQEELQTFSQYFSENINFVNLDNILELCKVIIDYSDQLRSLMLYMQQRNNTIEAGFHKIVKALEDNEIQASELSEVFETAYCAVMLNQILANSPVISNFVGVNQNERIKNFCRLDKQYIALSQNVVFAKLAERLPRRRTGDCPAGTELGLLKRECEKRSRRKPVRQLLEQIPTLIQSLKPCFLMSPMSVAQYLPPETAPFDLVIFDEASQIPVWDAIGVIARGKQLIVVGDPKQLPPTNFFQKGESEAELYAEDFEEDLESILSECLAAGVYSAYLNWHYRSRHETLIAFSNQQYYNSRLLTFPAAKNSDYLGVRFNFVSGGVYDRRATRTNLKEAEALVEYVFKRLENPQLKEKSIGIVTFNQAQKDLIEDLIEQKRDLNPQLENYFNEQREEPFFVKNLENVQGDERDIILFSICYAPDYTGKFSMNFGPLNRQGGERRLNVAITRAKELVVVFASIHSTQIDLSRTRSIGAMHLKNYLNYAEKGINIQFVEQKSNIYNEEVIKAVASFLNSKGFYVEERIGHSEYQIDLAVLNPDNLDEYLLGIECDGPAYQKQRNVRDREHLRHSVLSSLGWRMHRIWTVDWVFDQQHAKDELLEAIKQAKESPVKAERTETNFSIPTEKTAVNSIAEKPQHPVYQIWNSHYNGENQEVFYEERIHPFISEQMVQCINQEGPIYEKLLFRRISRAWGFTRTGEVINSILTKCIPPQCPTTEYGNDKVYWSFDAKPSEYRECRIPKNNRERRNIDEIPPEELSNAMLEILLDFHSCQQDTLFRETVRFFGYSAVTNKSRPYLELALKLLQQSGRI